MRALSIKVGALITTKVTKVKMASENSSDCVSKNGELFVNDSKDSLKLLQSQNNYVPPELINPVVETSQSSNLETPTEITDLEQDATAETVPSDDGNSTSVKLIVEEEKQSPNSNLEDPVEITNSQNDVIKVGSDVTDSSSSDLLPALVEPPQNSLQEKQSPSSNLEDHVEITNSQNDVIIVESDVTDSSSSDLLLALVEPPQNSLQQTLDLNSQNLPTQSVAIEVVDTTTTKLFDLETEVQRLRVENEQLNSKLAESKSSTEEENKAAISISFGNRTFYDLHKDKFTRLFDTFIDYCISVDETKLQITVIKDDRINPEEWIIIENDEVNEVCVSKKRKKKSKEKENKKKSKSQDQTEKAEFVLDTTPSLNADNNLKYESKFSVIVSEKLEEKADSKIIFNSCFNCGEEHNLRDCPHPKNGAKINAARQKFKRDQPPRHVRYHIENNAFTHLKPGKISQKLRDAMLLRDDELPEYIYRMRRLGYPPGWMKEISQNESDLVVFDFEGKTEIKRRKPVEEFNADLIVEYPGFNIPMGKYMRDDSKYFHCPPFSRYQSKNKMVEELNKKKKAAMDNLDACDMDLDTSFDDEQEKEIKCVSPTLLALESEKKKILDQLVEDNVSENVKYDDLNNSQESIDDGFKTIDKVGEVDSETDVSVVDLVNHITTSSFGTPLIESASPYSKLPDTENFAKNVSQVVIFENLPESTGKYDQLSGILSKVRKTMKDSINKSS